MENMDKRVFLLDAMALIFRAYYALISSPRITSKGRNTNAQFGFTNALIELINNQKPSHMAVCFDTEAPTERHTDFAAYKANRQEAPEDLISALPDIKAIVTGFNIPCVELDGFEADDVIGTLSKQAEAAGYEVFMVTPDKDYGQLVTEKVRIYKPGYQGGLAEVLGPKEVCEKWNIKDVAQVIDILGLMGDAVDNIPGIKGVGEKTAAKLLTEWGTLENVVANAENIKGALGEKVRAGKELALMSKKLATIITYVPVEFHEENFRLKEWNRDALNEIFNLLEFRTLGKRILGENYGGAGGYTAPEGVQTDLFGNAVKPAGAPKKKSGGPGGNGGAAGKERSPGKAGTAGRGQHAAGSSSGTRGRKAGRRASPAMEQGATEPAPVPHGGRNIHNTPHSYTAIVGEKAIAELVGLLKQQKEICFDTETTGIDPNDAELVGLSFSYQPGEAWYVPCPADQEATVKKILDAFRPLWEDGSITWIGQNLKFDWLMLKWYDVEPQGPIFDTMLAHYVIEPEGKRNMDLLSAQFLGYEPVHIEELIGKKGKGQGNMRDVELEKIKDYAAEDADITLQLKQAFFPQLQKKAVEKVFYEVENPLVRVLTDMEFEGIRVDMDFLREYSKELDRDARQAEERVYQQAGERFNLSSPKQLGEILFERMQSRPESEKDKDRSICDGRGCPVKAGGKTSDRR